MAFAVMVEGLRGDGDAARRLFRGAEVADVEETGARFVIGVGDDIRPASARRPR
jgi:hypothetical protein